MGGPTDPRGLRARITGRTGSTSGDYAGEALEDTVRMVLVVSLHVPRGEACGVRVPGIVTSHAGAPALRVRESLSTARGSSLDWPAKVRVSRLSWFSAQLSLQTLASPRQERLDLIRVNRVSPEPSRADAEPGATVDGTPRAPSSSWKYGVGDGWGPRAQCRASADRYVEACWCEPRRSTK